MTLLAVHEGLDVGVTDLQVGNMRDNTHQTGQREASHAVHQHGTIPLSTPATTVLSQGRGSPSTIFTILE